MKRPVVDLGDCIRCEVCTDVCPEVFFYNDTGFVDVVDLSAYPESAVGEAIKNCPGDCIQWEDA